jgi:MFS family permease
MLTAGHAQAAAREPLLRNAEASVVEQDPLLQQAGAVDLALDPLPGVLDAPILLLAKFVRMFSYGACAVALFIGLEDVGLSDTEITVLFGLTLLGDLLISFPLTTRADRWGRKNVLLLSAVLKFFAGLAFATQKNFYFLVFAGVVGVITPTGGEIGP